MKQIVRNFLIGFAVGSLGMAAWTGTAATASNDFPAIQTAMR